MFLLMISSTVCEYREIEKNSKIAMDETAILPSIERIIPWQAFEQELISEWAGSKRRKQSMLTKQSKSCLVVLMLAMFSLLTSSALLDAGNQRTIFTLQDSRDDDYGDGTLAYPLLRDDLQDR